MQVYMVPPTPASAHHCGAQQLPQARWQLQAEWHFEPQLLWQPHLAQPLWQPTRPELQPQPAQAAFAASMHSASVSSAAATVVRIIPSNAAAIIAPRQQCGKHGASPAPV